MKGKIKKKEGGLNKKIKCLVAFRFLGCFRVVDHIKSDWLIDWLIKLSRSLPQKHEMIAGSLISYDCKNKTWWLFSMIFDRQSLDNQPIRFNKSD